MAAGAAAIVPDAAGAEGCAERCEGAVKGEIFRIRQRASAVR
jgi:hypothetical protein